MIDTKELRRDADDAYVAHVPFEICGSELIELLDRLEAAEQTVQDYLRIDREKAQIAQRLEAAEKERDTLRAKVAEMEKQEPVKIQHRVPFVNSDGECVGYSMWKDGKGLDHWPHRSLYAGKAINSETIT